MKRDLGKQLQELHTQYIAPIEHAAQRAFGSEDGKKVLEALERAFGGDDVIKDANGAVDSNAHLIAFGSKRVIDYLRKLAESNEGQGNT